MLVSARLERVAFGAAVVAAASVGFERVDPSLGVTADLRLTNVRLLVALTVALWLLASAALRRRPRVPPRAAAVPAALWLLFMLLSALLAPTHQRLSLAFVRDVALGAAFGWAVYDLAFSPSRQRILLRALALTGMGVAALGVAEAINLRPVVEWLAGFRYQASFSVGDVMRVSSTLPHPNIAAMLLGLCVPVQLAWMATTRASWARIGLGLGAAAELAVLALTVSRAGVLVVELVLVLMLALAARQHAGRLARISLGAALGLPLLIGGAIALQPLLVLRLTSETAQDWYRADYATPPAFTAQPGQAATVPVRLANTGPRSWSATGEHPFALSYHLDQLDGTSLSYDGPRTPLPADLPPGGVVDLQARLIAPPTPGTYLVEWDGVQESVTWFSWTGTPASRTYLTVEGPPVAAVAPLSRSTAPPSSLVAPPPGRLMQWRMAVRMAGNRPLLGVGPDNFRWVYGDFAGLATWDTGGHANSLYFEWLADTGFIGLGLFLWLSWAVMRAAFVSLGVGASAWRVAVVGSLAAWFLHGFFDYFYEPLPTNVAFWLVAGLALAASARGRQHRQDAPACVSAST